MTCYLLMKETNMCMIIKFDIWNLSFRLTSNRYDISNGQDVEKMTGILSDEDQVWASLRHKYIADVMDRVHEKIVKFTDANSNFSNMYAFFIEICLIIY